MAKQTKLRPFKIYYDKQADIWVAHDLDTDYASQAETKEKAKAALIEALRLVILTLLDNWPKANPRSKIWWCAKWRDHELLDWTARKRRYLTKNAYEEDPLSETLNEQVKIVRIRVEEMKGKK